MTPKLYYLKCDLTDRWPFSITRVELNGADATLIHGLRSIGSWDARIRFYYAEYSMPADFQIPMVCPLHFATKNFVKALNDEQRHCFNFIPISIYPEHVGPIIEDFYIADYVFTLTALDMNVSKVVYDSERPDEILGVPLSIVDKTKVPSHFQAFRLRESPSKIIISQQIVDSLNKHSVTGTRFVPVKMVRGLDAYKLLMIK